MSFPEDISTTVQRQTTDSGICSNRRDRETYPIIIILRNVCSGLVISFLSLYSTTWLTPGNLHTSFVPIRYVHVVFLCSMMPYVPFITASGCSTRIALVMHPRNWATNERTRLVLPVSCFPFDTSKRESHPLDLCSLSPVRLAQSHSGNEGLVFATAWWHSWDCSIVSFPSSRLCYTSLLHIPFIFILRLCTCAYDDILQFPCLCPAKLTSNASRCFHDPSRLSFFTLDSELLGPIDLIYNLFDFCHCLVAFNFAA